jgi:carboxypeptidase D
MVDAKDKTYYDISGILVYDPCIGQCGYVAETVSAVPFVETYYEFFKFNHTYMNQIRDIHQKCGYAEYLEKFLVYPSSGLQPPLVDNNAQYNSTSQSCDVWNAITNAVFQSNPCFNAYNIPNACPILFDPLVFPTTLTYSYANWGTAYFNRTDVKAALHAPDEVSWSECSNTPVFVNSSDTSLDPTQHVLPKVIEHTKRVLVSNGDFDFVILNNGTLLAIQNMTWAGSLGFKKKPSEEIVIELPDLTWGPTFAANGLAGIDGPGQGTMGVQHYEDGLMWAQTFMSGHMQPQFQSRVSYRHVQWLLGHIEKL